MYSVEAKFKRMEAAKAKAKHFEEQAKRLGEQRDAALTKAAEWQQQWEWLNDMPTSPASESREF